MTSRLAEMQARFQQKQIQEKEEKLLRLYESQQQRAMERVGRGSAGSNSSLGSTTGGGKVRQMFDERRQKAGVDKSYPLEPLKGQNGKTAAATTTTKSTVVKSVRNVTQMRNGRPVKREAVKSVYNNNNNNNNNKSDERYEEHRFEDVGARNIINMMNDYDLNDRLDDEELPQIGFDETMDDIYISKKLANVGGKLPSQNSNNKKAGKSNLGATFRKETKPIVKRTVSDVTPAVVSSQSVGKSYPVSTTVKSQQAPTGIRAQPVSSPAKAQPLPSPSTSAPATAVVKLPPGEMATRPQKISANRSSIKQMAPKGSPQREDLKSCRYCGRHFAEDRVATHEDICDKTARKKRKAYDATKHRVEGTELEVYVKRGAKVRSAQRAIPKKDWRKTHEDFVNAIRAAKTAQAYVAKGGKLSDLPPPPPATNPDYVQCPHCNRRFNQAAAERHIPKCATYMYNKPKAGASPSKGRIASNKNLR